jgi:TP53 regulating kinase and related kinases
MHAVQPESVLTDLGEARLLRLLGKGKSGYSYLAALGTETVVLKQMHDEPCAYYSFGDNKVRLEVHAYHQLTAAGLALPRLLSFDEQRGFLVKEFVAGDVADRWDASPADLELAVKQLFEMAHRLQDCGLNIDYFPANFVINGGAVHYIDYEVNSYHPQWSLDFWGIYYWANRSGMRSYTQSHDWRHINESEHSGIPIKAPFESQVSQWRQRYGRQRGVNRPDAL